MRHAWDYTEDEPLIWWNYFLYYCTLGVGRSVARARAVVAVQQMREREMSAIVHHAPDGAQGDAQANRAIDEPLYSLSRWQRMARQYKWQARARAWDAWLAQRAQTPAEHLLLVEQRRSDLVVRQTLSRALHIFDAAELNTLEMEQARKLLPLAQGMVRTALQAQRDKLRAERQSGLSPLPATAAEERSDWQQAMAETVRRVQQLIEAGVMPTGKAGEPTASALIRALEGERPRREPNQPDRPGGPPPADGALSTGAIIPGAALSGAAQPHLLVVTGRDDLLEMDLAMVRAVAIATGLHYQSIVRATRDDLETSLRRARSLGRPVTWVHMACHVSHAGVLLADGVADGAWLSRVLMGVDVLLIAGCNGDRVGDWLAVVPHVITLSDAIAHDDAATLTRYFWQFLANGEPPTAALAQAMARCPQVLWESVVAHW